MKKIGILTLAPTDNYGGILQAIALHHALENLGHSATLLYKPYVDPFPKKIARIILENLPFQNLYDLKTKKQQRPIRQQRINKHRLFFENEMNISPNLYSYTDLRQYCLQEKFDALVVGSDQVWRRNYINDRYFLAYFLNFITNKEIKKYSYAASFGVNHWERPKEIPIITKLLNQFTAISVRESSGIGICQETFSQHRRIDHVLDPTLLFDKSYYKKNLINKYLTSEPRKNKLSTYLLDQSIDKKNIVDHVTKILDIARHEIQQLTTPPSDGNHLSVPQWLESLYSSEFIITDSFHGMVFSIVFERNFIVIANPERGLDRFTSLLKQLDLEERLISKKTSTNEITKLANAKIDYYKVQKKLQVLQEKSIDFLKQI